MTLPLRFLDGSDHPFCLAVGPWMIWPDLPIFDAILLAACTKDVTHKAIFSSLVVLDTHRRKADH